MLRLTACCLAILASCVLAPAAGAAVVPTPATSLHSAPATLGNDNTPTFTFSADMDFASFDCRWASTASESYSTADDFPCGSATDAYEQVSYSPGALTDGTRHFQVRACAVVDTGSEYVEKCDTSPSRATFTIDTTGPSAAFTAGTPAHGAFLNAPRSYHLSNPEGGDLLCGIDVADDALSACGSDSGQIAAGIGASQGEHVVKVRAKDALGNLGPVVSRTFTWDTIAPVVDVNGPSVTNSVRPLVSWNYGDADSELTRECRLAENGADPVLVNCPSGVWQPDHDLAEGDHVFHVTYTDRAGNTSAPGGHPFTVDLTAPVLELHSFDPATKTLEFDVTGDDGIECELDGGDPAPCSAPYDASGLAVGPHTLKVTAYDAAGNRTSQVAEFEIATEPDPGPQDPEDPQDPADPQPKPGGSGGTTPGGNTGPVAPATNGPVVTTDDRPVTTGPVTTVTQPKKKAKKRCAKPKRGKKAAKKKRAAKRRCGKPRKRGAKRVARRS